MKYQGFLLNSATKCFLEEKLKIDYIYEYFGAKRYSVKDVVFNTDFSRDVLQILSIA